MATDKHEEDDDNTLSNDFLDGDLTPGDFSKAFSDVDDDNDINLGNDDDDEIENDEDSDPDADDEAKEDGEDANEDGAETDAKKDDVHGADGDESEWYLRAELAKERGELPADLEIKKEISQIELEDIFAIHLHDNVMKRARAEVADAIRAKGFDPNTFFNNESDDEYMQKQYAGVAALSYDVLLERAGDKIIDNVRAIGSEYYTAKSKESLSEEEVTKLVNLDLDEMTEEEAFAKYHPYFVTESKRLASKIQSDAAARQKADTDKALADMAYIKTKLASKYTPAETQKILDALMKKDQWYDDGKTKRQVTLYEKRKLETATNIDHQLDEAIKLVTKQDPKESKEKDQRIQTVNTLERLARLKPSAGDNRKNQKSKKTTNKRHDYAPGDFVNN